MQHFTIRRGEPAPDGPAPSGPIEDVLSVTSVALLGEDWPGLRPQLKVEKGARVRVGQELFADRKHREVCFVSPVTGVVDSVTFGPRRRLDALVIRVEATGQAGAVASEHAAKDPREALLASGLWPAFRTRPFGSIPAPGDVPEAIIINGVHAAPQAPDPVLVLGGFEDDFHRGCEALAGLTQGTVYVCQSPGPELGPMGERIRHASFSGTVAAGLPGTQIDRLCRGQKVWSVDYQDVAAMGHFLATGRQRATRVVSVIGPDGSPPRLLRAPAGARIADVTGEIASAALSGGSGAGRKAMFLGRFDTQITLLAADTQRPKTIWSRRPGHSAVVPCRALERSIAVDVLPVQLLRALSIGDAEAAERLGCLALIEEDLATATRRCTSGVDYGACLRRVLDDVMAGAA